MECTTCDLREATGTCAVCQAPVCGTCAVACDECGATVCAKHVHWGTGGGRAVCGTCHEAAGQDAGTPPPAGADHREPPADTGPVSFEALQAELGAAPEQPPAPPRETPPPEDRQGMAEDGTRAPTAPDPHRRVLGASSPKATPTWVSGLFAGGLAWLLLMPLLTSGPNLFQRAQPFMSYIVMLLGLGTALWCGLGFLNARAPQQERPLNLIGLGLGLLAALVALAVRNPSGGV